MKEKNNTKLCSHTNKGTVVLEIFAGIKYCVSAYLNDIQTFNIVLANQNHNNQKEWL